MLLAARRRWFGLLPALAVGAATASAAVPQPSGSVVLTSDYVFEGLSMTCGHPALQADLHLAHPLPWPGSELFVGAWGSTGLGKSGCGAAHELNPYAGVSTAVGPDSKITLSYVRYIYPGGSYALFDGFRYDFDELNAIWSFQDRLHLSAQWTPDALSYRNGGVQRDRRAWAFSAKFSQPVTAALSLNAGAGYDCINDPQGSGYAFWSAGAAYAFAALQLEVLYVRTTAGAVQLFGGDVAGARVSASVLWNF